MIAFTVADILAWDESDEDRPTVVGKHGDLADKANHLWNQSWNLLPNQPDHILFVSNWFGTS